MKPLPSADRWKTLEPLVDAALELPANARPSFIQRVCGGDRQLATELEQMLGGLDRADPLLDRPAAERFPSLADDRTELVHETLNGRYRIERELGRGGMATVYLARDLDHDRQVAIKVLRADLSAAVGAERFLAEIRVTAKLQHPHILSLYDSGHIGDLLYYVMPYIAGESLRQRLERERRLPIDEATRIACEIASALDAAHGHGVIHRDVKPENILFADGRAMVADFGIALALSDAQPRLTKTGVVLGTPQYMSPEQATGDGPIDRRTDIYALGSIMFEMLAGEPPFTGASVSTVLAKRAAVPATPVRVLRPAVSHQMDAAVARALAREPLDRFDTAGEFADALRRSLVAGKHDVGLATDGQSPRAKARGRRLRRRTIAFGAVAASVGIVTLMARRTESDAGVNQFVAVLQGIGLVDTPLDTLSYVVLAPAKAEGLVTAPDVAEPLRNALRRWRELKVPDAETIAAAGASSARAAAPAPHRIATALRAGRYVKTTVATVNDSLEVVAELFDTRTDGRLDRARVRVGQGRAIAEPAMESLAEALVFRGELPRIRRDEGNARTSSLYAREAFLRGHVALEHGHFARADSEFSKAVELDPQYAQALVWLAQIRSWIGSRDRAWDQLPQQAAQAVSQRGQLASADSMLLDALRTLAAGRSDSACPAFARLTARASLDFTARYALGNCLRHDGAVVRDSRSPSGWRFRSSYAAAIRAYREAFRLQPAVLRGFGERSLAELQGLLNTSSARTRVGRAIRPDTQQFRGIPVWDGDSLSFLPLTSQMARLALLPSTVNVAIQRQREVFQQVAQLWRSEFPDSADGAEAVAAALGMLGDQSALDTLRLARRLARSADDSLRIAGTEVFVRLKFSLPSDLRGVRAARSLADSLVNAHPPAERRGLQMLASLAVLTGRATLAASYAAVGRLDDPPPPIASSGPALLAYAALGGPDDSLQSLETQVETGLATLLESERERHRSNWLLRPAMLAFPEFQLQALPQGATSAMLDVGIVAAAAAGDTARVRGGIARVAAARASIRRADVTIDGVFPEAMALAQIGDARAAATWLDPSFGTLRVSSTQDLVTVARTGSLVRALSLRADLAERLGDVPTARRFADAVVVLWSGADPFLQPTVQRMERLVRLK
jgi:tetratricopeptide (TPR) repeat protein